MSVILALFASLTYGAADFYGGLAGRRMPTLVVVLWSQATGLALAILVAMWFPPTDLARTDVAWGAAGGVVGTIGLYAFYQGLATRRMSVVSPVAALLTAVVPLAIGLQMGERPIGLEWIGIAIAFPAIWLVASTSTEGSGREGGVRYGLVAGLGFGLFFAALAQTGAGAGFWPLVAARAVSVVAIGALVIVRKAGMPPVGSRLLVALVGAGDILANVCLLLAFRSGLLTLVAVLASLYPAITMLLAVVKLAEPIGGRQRLGLVMALVAVALIAM
jgi:uncharacterized membrane protein